MSENPRVAAVLKSELKTSALSRWLEGLLREMSALAPPASQEAIWSLTHLNALQEANRAYSLHRKVQDPERASSHQNLYKTFCDVTRRVHGDLSRFSQKPGIKLPCSEQELEALFRKRLNGGEWLYRCSGCSQETRETAGWWIKESTPLCPSCTEQYTLKCAHCDERAHRDRITTSQYIRDTESQTSAFACGNCARKPLLNSAVCQNCGCKYANGPSGNPEDGVSAQDIKDACGLLLCFHCAADWRRGDCSHVASRLYDIPNVVNVEDDDRDREDIGRGNVQVCAKCRDAHKPIGDDDIEHWNASKNKCGSRTYTDLGSKRSFGVEIEVVQPQKMRPMPEDMKAYWTSKRDLSLPEMGVELASTILYGDTGLQVVKDLCDYAKKHDWRVDARAGFHVHIGLPDTRNEALAAIAMGYHLTYDLWSSFVAPSRQRCKYCRKNSCDAKKMSLASPTDLLHMILSDPSVEGRRCWVNWHSYQLLSTVEIRLHHGTISYDKVSNWVKAHARFVDWCAGIGSHEKIHKLLSDKTVREQFLLVTQAAWKDRTLGRWYRSRAKTLFDGCAPLPESNRKLLKRGIKPSEYKPGFSFKIGDVPAYVLRSGERYYTISDHPSGSKNSKCIATNGWSKESPPAAFSTRVEALNFIKDASCDGLGNALSRLKPAGRSKAKIATPNWGPPMTARLAEQMIRQFPRGATPRATVVLRRAANTLEL